MFVHFQHLYQGIYYVYLKEWVDAFGADNVHVLRLEDWKNDTVSELNSVLQYLELGEFSKFGENENKRIPSCLNDSTISITINTQTMCIVFRANRSSLPCLSTPGMDLGA